jgi:putative sterol carrier protein
MESKTPKEFFEKNLPTRFKPEKSVGIDVVAQIDITDGEGSSWFVVVKDQKLEVNQGTHPDPNLTLKMKESDFMDLANGKLSAEKAFFLGKIQFKGNISVALKLRETGFL